MIYLWTYTIACLQIALKVKSLNTAFKHPDWCKLRFWHGKPLETIAPKPLHHKQKDPPFHDFFIVVITQTKKDLADCTILLCALFCFVHSHLHYVCSAALTWQPQCLNYIFCIYLLILLAVSFKFKKNAGLFPSSTNATNSCPFFLAIQFLCLSYNCSS